MADNSFDIYTINIAMKKASKGPIALAFRVCSNLSNDELAVDSKRTPEYLGRALKKGDFSVSKVLVRAPQIKVCAEAGKLVRNYVKYVNVSPLVQEIDSNPFKPVAVKKTLDMTLKVLTSRLAA